MTNFQSIFHNKFCSALLADAAFRAKVPHGVAPYSICPLDRGMKFAGPIITVQANNDLVTILAAIHQANAGDVVVIANQKCEVALIGDLIATEAKRKGLAGIVVDGLVRDAEELINIEVPVFSKGTYPVGPLKLPKELKSIGSIGIDISLGSTFVKHGGWAFGDADGIVFIRELDLPKVFDLAEKAFHKEELLATKIRSGVALGELLELENFLEKRESDPDIDFNEHLSKLSSAI